MLTQIVFIMLMVHEIKKKTLMSGELINGLSKKAQRCNSFQGKRVSFAVAWVRALLIALVILADVPLTANFLH